MHTLPRRAHGGDCDGLARACACTTVVTCVMSIIEYTLHNCAVHRSRIWQRSPLLPGLTLDDPSVIVISFTGKPAHPHDDALAPSSFIDPRLAAYATYRALPYKFHNTAP